MSWGTDFCTSFIPLSIFFLPPPLHTSSSRAPQVGLSEPCAVILGSYAKPSATITEFVEITSTVADIVDLIQDHRIAVNLNASTLLVVCKRTTGTTIIAANFSASSTIEHMLIELGKIENIKIKHLTFMVAPDGNLHIYADHTSDKEEEFISFPRPVYQDELQRVNMNAVLSRQQPGDKMTPMMSVGALKHEICLNELRHPKLTFTFNENQHIQSLDLPRPR